MRNYVLRRDYDGGVFLAHSAPQSIPKTERPGHKYILRLLTNAGTRYFYTVEQVRSYYNAAKNAVAASNAQRKSDKAQKKFESSNSVADYNALQRERGRNNAAQRTAYESRKQIGFASSEKKNGSPKNGGKGSQNAKPGNGQEGQSLDNRNVEGRSRGQSNLYRVDGTGHAFRPGVIGEKPNEVKTEAPKTTAEKARSKGQSDKDAVNSAKERTTKAANAYYELLKNPKATKRELDAAYTEYNYAVANMRRVFQDQSKRGIDNGVSQDDLDNDALWRVQVQHNRNDRPESRQRNVTGKADPIQKDEGLRLGSVRPKEPEPEHVGEPATIIFEDEKKRKHSR